MYTFVCMFKSMLRSFNAGQDQQKSVDTNSTDETLYDGNGTAAVDR